MSTTPTVDAERKPRQAKKMFRLADTQYEILDLIYQFKILRSHHIAMHLEHRHYRGIRHSLQTLEQRGFIVQEKRIYHNSIWTLTRKGWKAVTTDRKVPYRYFLDGANEFEFPSNREFTHQLMIIDILSNLVAGAHSKGFKTVTVEQAIEKAKADHPFVYPRHTTYVNKDKNLVPYTMIPDGYLGIYYPQGKIIHLSIEAENNKAITRSSDFGIGGDQNSSRKKLLQYMDVDWKKVYENLGISNMRVLVAAPTPERTEKIIKSVEKEIKPTGRFLAHYCPVAVGNKDVPTMPEMIDNPFIRVGMEATYINAPTDNDTRKAVQSSTD